MSKGLIALVFCVLWGIVQGEVVRVATYNVANYNITDRMVNGRYRKEYPKPEEEKTALRAVIREVNPDILVVQEMGGESYLRELQQDLAAEGLEYKHAYLSPGQDTSRHVALLSKLPWVAVRQHAHIPFKYKGNRHEVVKRGLLEMDFSVNGAKWTLYGLHLKSRARSKKGDFESEKQRLGEAYALRNIVRDRFPETGEYLIVGDFNDHRKSKTLKRFLKVGKRRLSIMLDAADSRGEVWTHRRWSHGTYSRIDFMLASEPMAQRLKGESASIMDAPSGKVASDHRMVYADFEF